MAERRLTRNQKKNLARTLRSRKQTPAPKPRRQKATGWRIPLIFCAVFVALAAMGWGYRKVSAPPPLPINQELVDLAARTHVNLDADEEGRKYKEELISAGRGISPAYVKDEKVLAVADRALGEGRVDVGVTAVQVLRDGDKRVSLLKDLAEEGMRDCKNIAWAVYAVRNLVDDYPLAMDLTTALNARWDECKKEPVTEASARTSAADTEGTAAPEPQTGADATLPEGNGTNEINGAGQVSQTVPEQNADGTNGGQP